VNICIYGAGAIGGFLGGELALAGADISLIARGPHLKSIQENGLTIVRNGKRRTARPFATEYPAEAGPQDYVIVTLKAHSVPGIVDAMQPLLGPETTVVWGVNGLPWWYFHELDGPYRNRRLETVDPGNVQWEGIGPERILGCVVYPAAEVEAPGVIRHEEGDRFSLGELDGSLSERAKTLAQAMIGAGLRAPLRPRIRDEIWIKLWGNLSFNPISALTGATLEQMGNDLAIRGVIRAMMVEARAIGEAVGAKFAIGVDQRIDGGTAVGAHKTSMLQDLERGRPMEIDALLGAVAEMGRMTGIECPTVETVLALIRQRARLAGCYPG
jgi:2-dehydropantoate 2-reductase